MPENRKHRFGAHWKLLRLTESAGAYLRRALWRWQAGRTAAALESLGDDVLRDIGITRAQIPALAVRVTAPDAPHTERVGDVPRPAFTREATR